DGAAGVALDEPAYGVRDPRLHLDERLAPGEPEAAGMALHDRPVALTREPTEGSARPCPEVALEEPALDADREAARAGDGRGCLARALQRRRIDGGDPGQRGQTLGDGLR